MASPGRSVPRRAEVFGIDSVLHQRTRLMVVLALARHGTLTFSQLTSVIDAADGTLLAHMRRLEEASYVTTEKLFVGRVSQTRYTLTPDGRDALDSYLDRFEKIIENARSH